MRSISQWLPPVLMLAIVAALPTISHGSRAEPFSTVIALYRDASCSTSALMQTFRISDGACQDLEQEQVSSIRVTTAPYCETGPPLLYLFEEPQCCSPHLRTSNDGVPGCIGAEISRRIKSFKFECAAEPDPGGEAIPFPQASLLVPADSSTPAATVADDAQLVKAVLGPVQSIQNVTIAVLALVLLICGLAAYGYWKSYREMGTAAVRARSP
jgi:hypothetical protein